MDHDHTQDQEQALGHMARKDSVQHMVPSMVQDTVRGTVRGTVQGTVRGKVQGMDPAQFRGNPSCFWAFRSHLAQGLDLDQDRSGDGFPACHPRQGQLHECARPRSHEYSAPPHAHSAEILKQ